jgi:hypothetical protein
VNEFDKGKGPGTRYWMTEEYMSYPVEVAGTGKVAVVLVLPNGTAGGGDS